MTCMLHSSDDKLTMQSTPCIVECTAVQMHRRKAGIAATRFSFSDYHRLRKRSEAPLGRKADIPGELLRGEPTRRHDERGLLGVQQLALHRCLSSVLSGSRAMTASSDDPSRGRDQ